MVETRLVRIGNSRGVRLPKALLEQAGMTDEVQLEARDGEIVIHAQRPPVRQGWAEAARLMADLGEDVPLWPDDMEDEWDEKG